MSEHVELELNVTNHSLIILYIVPLVVEHPAYLINFQFYYCAVPIHGHITASRTEHLWVRYICHGTSLMRTTHVYS